MGLIFTIIFIVLAIMFYQINKEATYPPFILSVVWATSLFLVWLSGNIFFDISFNTYVIYFIGTFVFGIGYIFAESIYPVKTLTALWTNDNQISSPNSIKNEGRIITIILIILVIALPYYYIQISNAFGLSLLDSKTFFYQVRIAELKGGLTDAGEFSLVKNIIPISSLLSLYAYNIFKKNGKNKTKTYLIILISTLLQLLTGGRSGAVSLILGIIAIDLLREKKLKVKNLIFFVCVLLFVILFIAFFVGKGSVDNTKSLIDNSGALFQDIVFYLLGGIVAFGSIIKFPGSVASNGGVLRFFLETGRSLGFNVYVPGLHMEYTSIGNGLVTNVYTMYGSYYIDYGLLGTCILMFLYGCLMFFIAKKAKDGSNLFSVLYGSTIAGLILSIYNEGFFTDLNYIIKLILIVSILEFSKKIRFGTKIE